MKNTSDTDTKTMLRLKYNKNWRQVEEHFIVIYDSERRRNMKRTCLTREGRCDLITSKLISSLPELLSTYALWKKDYEKL